MSQFITIKLKLKEELPQIVEFQRKYNNVVRYAFNRSMDGIARGGIFKLVKSLNNVDELDISWREQASKLGEYTAKSHKAKDKENNETTSVIFGGKGLFYKRLRGYITHEEFISQRKLQPITCEGSKADHHGNRKFKFDVETMSGSVKLTEKVEFSCERTSKKNMLLLRTAMEMAFNQEIGITYKLSTKYLYIMFDLEKLPKYVDYVKDNDTTLALDMNPNYIGLSIVRCGEVVLRRSYDLSKIDCNKKRKYELVEIVKCIAKLCIDYHVSLVGYEKLVIPPKNNKKGKRYNRQVNNEWCRDTFVNSLKKHLTFIGCKYQDILPQYSSFIGCVMYQDDTDSIAASIELNRRLIEFKRIYLDKTQPRGCVLYPSFDSTFLNRWKEDGTIDASCVDWVSAYRSIKKSKSSYRLLYNDYVRRTHCAVFRLKSAKSFVTFINVTNKIALFN